MAALQRAGSVAVGVDVAPDLLERAAAFGEIHQAEVPSIPLDSDSVDGVAIVLTLEHIRDEEEVLAEAARVVRPGGVLAVVINHPIWTAPRSTPIIDEDAEMLWRPGEYFSAGWSDEPAGERTVRFHHRTLSRLLNSASHAGWNLRRVVEEGITPAQIARTPGLAGQEHIPRLLGVRWELG
jgi:SAM-dependent methyltransferase